MSILQSGDQIHLHFGSPGYLYATVLIIEDEENNVQVEVTGQNGDSWREGWNLSHVMGGLLNGDYKVVRLEEGMKIFKYEVAPNIEMALDAKILSVGMQDGRMFLWAAVYPNARKVIRKIRVAPTGWGGIEEGVIDKPFLGTVIIEDKGLVRPWSGNYLTTASNHDRIAHREAMRMPTMPAALYERRK